MENPKAFERKTNRDLVKLHTEESHLVQLQAELSRNPKFIQFLEEQKKLQKKTDGFWAKVKQQMIDNGITEITIDNDFTKGKLSISYVKSYEAPDIREVSMKYIVKTLDTKKVAADVEKTGQLPKGVDEKGFYRLNKTLKTKDVVS